MELIVCDTALALAERASSLISAQVHTKPDSVLGLATGSTPIETYRRLIEEYRAGKVSFSRVCSYNLDEYIGLAPSHPQSYAYFMRVNLFDHLDIVPNNTHVPCGTDPDPQKECLRYTEALDAISGGLDLQLLGMGNNGHIGFNEPGECFVADTHVVDLDKSTIEANARFFTSVDQVPLRAITMGIRPIIGAKHVLLLLYGKQKASTLRAALAGPVTPRVPASILQLHPRVTVIADREAASLL